MYLPNEPLISSLNLTAVLHTLKTPCALILLSFLLNDLLDHFSYNMKKEIFPLTLYKDLTDLPSACARVAPRCFGPTGFGGFLGRQWCPGMRHPWHTGDHCPDRLSPWRSASRRGLVTPSTAAPSLRSRVTHTLVSTTTGLWLHSFHIYIYILLFYFIFSQKQSWAQQTPADEQITHSRKIWWLPALRLA